MSQWAFENGRCFPNVICLRLRFLFYLGFLFLILSCNSTVDKNKRYLEFEKAIAINDVNLKVAVFDTKEERSLGLMRIGKLEPLTGALFIYPQPSSVNFWMGNTYIPLDILYFDESLSLVGIVKEAQPCVKKPCLVYPAQDIRYVVEVNAGFVDQHAIKLGMVLKL